MAPASSLLPARLRYALGVRLMRLRLRRRVLLVGDGAGWIIDHVASNLAASLPAELRASPAVAEWPEARGSIVHFINRWAWLEQELGPVHPSNRLIGLWWHGLVDAPEPDAQASIRRVRELHPRFARMQVTCSIHRGTMLEVGVPEEKLVLLPMGIDLGRFGPDPSGEARRRLRAELGIAEDARVVGCFQKDGQGWGDGMEPKRVKAPDVLADALERLHARVPVVALIPGPARGWLEDRLKTAGVPYARPGFVPDEALPSLYHALDLYVSPSRDEGGPAGVLEAMASGVPVVSTRAGMPTDMITNGRDGFLVDVEDAEALAAHAAELLESRALWERVARGGLETIRRYAWRALGPRYADELYRPVLRERR